MSDQPTAPAPDDAPPPPSDANGTPDPGTKKKWGCLQWALLAVAVVVLLCGLCTAVTLVMLSNADFR
jgi:flagellar basal body-associated protein FliL